MRFTISCEVEFHHLNSQQTTKLHRRVLASNAVRGSRLYLQNTGELAVQALNWSRTGLPKAIISLVYVEEVHFRLAQRE